MKGFAVIRRLNRDDLIDRHPLLGRVWGIDKLIMKHSDRKYLFNETIGETIDISSGFENSKVKMACKRSIRKYGYSLSRDYGINYNAFFHHSALIRGLDIMTVRLGCDLRLSEVVIADASTAKGINCFRLLAPFARRIVLVTEDKSKVEDEVDYAMINYGISVAVVKDPIKAGEHADVFVLSSIGLGYEYFTIRNRPTLFLDNIDEQGNNLSFNEVEVQYNNQETIDSIYAQGYLDVNRIRAAWVNAEKEGFRIKNIKRGDNILMEL